MWEMEILIYCNSLTIMTFRGAGSRLLATNCDINVYLHYSVL